MGRGLSELQKTILRIATRNRRAENRGVTSEQGADAYYAEVLAESSGWTPDRAPLRYGPRYGRYAGLRAPGGQHFRKSLIGDKSYNAAHAALSRAARRLEARGLVQRRRGANSRWSGVSLTPSGASLTASHPAL